MKVNSKTSVMAVSCLEDMVKVNNINMAKIEKYLFKSAKSVKRLKLISIINLAGLLYLFNDNKKKSDEIDRLKEEQKNLATDMKYCPCSKDVEYGPEKDDFWG